MLEIISQKIPKSEVLKEQQMKQMEEMTPVLKRTKNDGNSPINNKDLYT